MSDVWWVSGRRFSQPSRRLHRRPSGCHRCRRWSEGDQLMVDMWRGGRVKREPFGRWIFGPPPDVQPQSMCGHTAGRPIDIPLHRYPPCPATRFSIATHTHSRVFTSSSVSSVQTMFFILQALWSFRLWWCDVEWA